MSTWAERADAVSSMGSAEGFTQDMQAQAKKLTDGPWPPPGAQAVPVEDLYDRMAERGYDYGPASRGLRRRGAMTGSCSQR